MAAPILLTVGEVAAILRVTERTIYQWLRARKLIGVKIGGLWRIDEENLPR